ncbi:MAG TPA: MmgE/PrpD family protein [Bryobacteraceae bacterium]|jgi:2-methylcitrate dehydratase PrpD
MTLSEVLARWVCATRFEDLPADVVAATRFRVLDVIGLALAGAGTEFGSSVRQAALAMASPGPCHVLATGDAAALTAAAFANGAFPQALEFDDTHVESIVHMSSPAVAAALALSEIVPVSGRDLITAVAIANEISCRVGSVSSGELHRRGFHPTGLFAPFGAAYLTSKLLGLDVSTMKHAAGVCGSLAAGLLECWVDGTQAKFLHSGFAAQSGITAALLARSGNTGPAQVFEGRFGLFAAHVQDPAAHRDFSRIDNGLGTHWESRNSSFKPFPAAHVIHPYISALLRIRERHAITAEDVELIECPVAPFIVGIVCEPVEEKWAPASDSHGRVSLQYTLAETLYCGELGKHAYRADKVRHPEILDLARRVSYYADPELPGPGRFKGIVRITLRDGRSFEEVEEYNRGSLQNPMSEAELLDKFHDNAASFLLSHERHALAQLILKLEELPDASALISLAAPSNNPQ